jgi:hypothetical protein
LELEAVVVAESEEVVDNTAEIVEGNYYYYYYFLQSMENSLEIFVDLRKEIWKSLVGPL